MTAKQSYYKYKSLSDLSIGLITYILKFGNELKIERISVEFFDRDLENIKLMEKAEKNPDFYKWTNDPDFEESLKEAEWVFAKK